MLKHSRESGYENVGQKDFKVLAKNFKNNTWKLVSKELDITCLWTMACLWERFLMKLPMLWSYKRTGIICKKIIPILNYFCWIRRGFEVKCDSLHKKISIFSYQATNFLKIFFLFRFIQKEKKRKIQFVTNLQEIKLQLILYTNASQIASKLSATQFSFIDLLKCKL